MLQLKTTPGVETPPLLALRDDANPSVFRTHLAVSYDHAVITMAGFLMYQPLKATPKSQGVLLGYFTCFMKVM
jgi:hypothetical protein